MATRPDKNCAETWELERGSTCTPASTSSPTKKMRRREFVGLIGGAAVLQPLAARAQRRREVPELGVLMSVGENDQGGRLRIAAFRQALQALGWKDGENIRVEYRWGASQKELIHQYAQELVSLAPDVILANGTPVVAALRPLNSVDSDCLRAGHRSGWSWVRAEPVAPGRQYHRLQLC